MWILWVKAIHVLAVMSWMAGLLYLPRLMVYHVETEIGSAEDERFRTMERRLLRVILNPASLVALVSGAAMVWSMGYLGMWQGNVWFWVKLAAVVALFGSHGLLSRHVKELARGERKHGQRYFRVLNEVPTGLMIIIVVAVIVKPF